MGVMKKFRSFNHSTRKTVWIWRDRGRRFIWDL